MSTLLILESPSKAHTVKTFLGNEYKVVASKGHIRDLPQKTLGVDIDHNFMPHYINISGKTELIKELKKEAKKVDIVLLATDPDREGEAISWHLANALKEDAKKIKRVAFNEITKDAVTKGISNPRDIDMNLVDSQQTRRILDRIVGYKISPFLWKTIHGGLSAGRVQSVATRIIVERENEIRAFIPSEYWSIEAEFKTDENKKFTAKLHSDKNGKIELKNKDQVETILNILESNPNAYIVTSIKKGVRTKNPAPPFITSTLQQEGSKKLGFQLSRIMKVAQELYEGIDLGSANGGTQGLITYMRTDSLRIAKEAQEAAKDFIVNNFGENCYPSKPRIYKSRNNAQDAHEAIRPSKVELTPERVKQYLSSDQYKLYKLIWSRFVASQMESAKYDTISADIENNGYIFRASGSQVRFAGYLSIYKDADTEKDNDAILPTFKKDDKLKCSKLKPEQHFTEPPARYTEASLVKFLEEMGIGRPSTYTPIITNIISREYVEREGKSLKPTSLGEVVTKLMVENFSDIMDYKFTASVESKLDSIEEGKASMNSILTSFYNDFEKELNKATKSLENRTIEVPNEELDVTCDKCGAKMIIKKGRFGKFAACPNYPKCKNTKPLTKDGKVIENIEQTDPISTDLKCEKCGSEMVLRSGRYGNFYACVNYPKCKNTKNIANEIGVKCPDCGGNIVERKGKRGSTFYSCDNYPKCKFSKNDLPTNDICPNCGKMLLKKQRTEQLICIDKECGYKSDSND